MNSFIPLYQINEKLYAAFDEATGELLISEEELDNIFAQEADGLEYFLKLYKNAMATAAAYEAEAKSISKRAERYKRVAARALKTIDKHQNGTQFECEAGQVKYTKSTRCEQMDEMAFMSWDGRFQYGKSEFTPSKTDITRAIKSGQKIPGWALNEYNNISIN